MNGNPTNTITEQAAHDPLTDKVQTYTPGYVPQKIGMLMICLSLLALGCAQLLPTVKLLLIGQRADAEATCIIRTQDGRPEVKLTRDAEWKTTLEHNDRSMVFWNEFRFVTIDGKTITFRASVGRQLQPPHPLLDDDGLPTVVSIYYEPENPKKVAMPLELSTWFFPGTITLFGLIGSSVSLLILYYARKPIVLPHIPDNPSEAE